MGKLEKEIVIQDRGDKMANITKRNGSYMITIYKGRDENGKQIKEYATFVPDPNKTEKQNQKALNKFVTELEKEVRDGKYLAGRKMLFSEFVELWIKDHCKENMAPTTYERSKKILEKDITPYFRTFKMVDIKPLNITRWLEWLKERGYYVRGKRHDYKKNSILRIFQVLSSALTSAMYWQIIDENPCKRVKRPPSEKSQDVKHFTVEEAIAFLEFIKKPYLVTCGRGKKSYTKENVMAFQLQVLFNLAIYGGFRRGEMIALTWNDIDFKNNSVNITKAMVELRDEGKQVIKEPKTRGSIREVVLPKETMNLLRELKKQRKIFNIDGTDYLFIQDNGKPMHLETPDHAFKKAIKRYNANEENEHKLPDIPLHGLRHTCATLLISKNVDIKEVSSRLGHADATTTLNIYTHALKKRDEEAAEVLGELLKIES